MTGRDELFSFRLVKKTSVHLSVSPPVHGRYSVFTTLPPRSLAILSPDHRGSLDPVDELHSYQGPHPYTPLPFRYFSGDLGINSFCSLTNSGFEMWKI